MLSEEQLRFFQTFGFLKFDGLLDDSINEIIAAFEEVWAAHGGGHHGREHDGQARSCLIQFIDRSERLSALLDDPRILGILNSLLGEDFAYWASDGNYYVGDTNWHSDGAHREMLHVKLGFYLDPLRADTGCLRVIPGSHHVGDKYADALNKVWPDGPEYWGVQGAGVPAYPIETKPGDLICFNHNLKHGAFGGHARRRMFTINACQRYPAHMLDQLRRVVASLARFWVDEPYGEAMVRTAGPERMRHLEQVLANASHLPELSREARAKMAEPARG